MTADADVVEAGEDRDVEGSIDTTVPRPTREERVNALGAGSPVGGMEGEINDKGVGCGVSMDECSGERSGEE